MLSKLLRKHKKQKHHFIQVAFPFLKLDVIFSR